MIFIKCIKVLALFKLGKVQLAHLLAYRPLYEDSKR